MACHLDGGSCAHDWGMGGGGDYLTSGSSSYGRMSSYAAAPRYTGSNVPLGSYAGSGNAGAEYLPAMNSFGLASYAANPKYGAVYKGAGKYVGQNVPEKKNQSGKPQKILFAYRNQEGKDTERNEQQFIAQDVARPTATRNSIDDTLDQTNAITVQRNFLEQMIQQAKQQAIAPQQMQYRVMYQ
ncbi:hypothetical protein HZA99_05870 [Candidatus Woesearchaeota archaeon]|nr:hypothetical protein [Candidatus Woesearchaeota archaeon]